MVGNPGDINRDGNTETHIGDDGFADRERHNTDHGYPNIHTNPHDHEITWENNRPNFGEPINYPDGAPEFKKYGGTNMLGKIIHKNTPEQNRFETISDFKWCMRCGGEVEFIWNDIHYGIVRYGLNKKITIYIWNEPDTAQTFDSADEALEYMLGNDRLRDVITQVTVIDRTI